MLVFLLQDRMCNFSKQIRWRKTCARVELGPSRIDGHSMVAVLPPNAQDMHKIIVLSSMCKICATLYS